MENTVKTKFCKHCGGKIPEAAVICTLCGCQVEEFRYAQQPNVIIHNNNNNVNNNKNVVSGFGLRARNKWTAFFLCFFLGFIGAHKFYEGRIGAGILYIFTCGLFGFGWFLDCIALLLKPNPYFVR